MNNGLLGFGGLSTLPFATSSQAQEGISTSTISSPARVRDGTLGLVRLPWAISYTGNGGSISQNQNQILWILTTSTTVNGYAATVAGSNGATYQHWSLTGIDNIDWSKPRTVAVRMAKQVISTNGVFRLQLGSKSAYNNVGQLNGRGIGLEMRNRRIWLTAHNGTVLSQIDTGIDYAANNGDNSIGLPVEFILRSDALGGVYMTYNTSTMSYSCSVPGIGPTSTGAGSLSAELTNGGDATSNVVTLAIPFVTFA